MGFPFGETVTIHAHGEPTQDGDGNDVPTWNDRSVAGVAVQPRRSAELVQGQTTNIVGLSLTFKPPEVLSPLDEVTVRGVRWKVDGDPGDYHSPLTGTETTEVNLTRAEG